MSPVIGVILMVAVTVILAAVIGTFVLGIGSQVTSETPTSSFEFDFDNGGDGTYGGINDDVVEVTHRGGDEVEEPALSLRIGGDSVPDGEFSWDNTGDTVGAGDTGTYDEGAGGTVDVNDGDDVKLIWEDPDGEGSAILAETQVE